MTAEQYFAMCEQMGWEPNLEEIPLDYGSFSMEMQQALSLFGILPDRIEGMSGSWLGKDFSCLNDFMDIYEVEDKRKVLEYILYVQSEYHEHYSEQQKAKSKK